MIKEAERVLNPPQLCQRLPAPPPPDHVSHVFVREYVVACACARRRGVV